MLRGRSLALIVLLLVAPLGLGATSVPTSKVAITPSVIMPASIGPIIATKPFAGLAPGAFVRVHDMPAEVAAMTPDGAQLWRRAAISLYADHTNWTQNGWMAPEIRLDASWVDPQTAGSPRAFSVGDLNGDGVDDVAFGMDITTNSGYDKPFTYSLKFSCVYALDGRDGHSLWVHLMPGHVEETQIANGMLYVADRTGDHVLNHWDGFDGSTSALAAFTFVANGTKLDGTQVWTYGVDKWATWIDSIVAGNTIVASWTNTSFGSTDPVTAHLFALDARTGQTIWARDTAAYPRWMRYDDARGELAIGMEDQMTTSTVVMVDDGLGDKIGFQGEHFGYSLDALSLADGSTRMSVAVPENVLADLAIGDATGDARPEWFATDVVLQSPPAASGFGSQRVSDRFYSIDPDTGATLWSTILQNTTSDPRTASGSPDFDTPIHLAFAATAAGPRIVTGVMQPLNGYDTSVMDAATGRTLWREPGLLYPNAPSVVERAGQQVLVGFSDHSIERTVDLDTGALLSSTPLFARAYGMDAGDLNGDGVSDLVLGTESGGVFALDGTKLAETPVPLWTRVVPGEVHQVQVVPRGASSEIVAISARLDGEQQAQGAMSTGPDVSPIDSTLSVFDAQGTLLFSHTFDKEFAWSFATGDLNGDGIADIVVPAREVTAIDGATGATLWTFAPGTATIFSNVAIAPGPRVVGQLGAQLPDIPREDRHVDVADTQLTNGFRPMGAAVAFALDGPTGSLQWAHPATAPGASVYPILMEGVVAGAGVPVADGYGMAVAMGLQALPTVDGSGAHVVVGDQSRIDVLDVRTGNVVMSSEPTQFDLGMTGMHALPDAGLWAHSYFSSEARCMKAAGTTHPKLIVPGDITEADFGASGKQVVVVGNIDVNAYDPGVLCGADGRYTAALGTYPKSNQPWPWGAGHVMARDLDHDGRDEILTGPWDILTYYTTGAIQGGGGNVAYAYQELFATTVFKANAA